MTPWQTLDLVEAWNDLQAGDAIAPPTGDDYDRLVAEYG